MTIAAADFGKDHWSLLAYVETCCVGGTNGGTGVLDKRKLRCNPARHPLHDVNANIGVPRSWLPAYGTRLSGFWRPDDTTDPARQLPDHDDWDGLDDLEAAGFITVLSEANGFVRMTAVGQAVAGRLRAFKAEGGQFAAFLLVPKCPRCGSPVDLVGAVEGDACESCHEAAVDQHDLASEGDH